MAARSSRGESEDERPISAMRKILRAMGAGRLLLRCRSWLAVGAMQQWRVARARKLWHERVLELEPLPAGEGDFELHMLLHHARFLDGMWAVYSLGRFVRGRLRLVIHDDGSLLDAEKAAILKLFPGARIISRQEADATVTAFLQERGLHRCVQFRKELIFALKLFDPLVFAEQERCVVIDSDVIFFRKPAEVLEGGVVYSQDNGHRYCVSDERMLEVAGRVPVKLFNPGVFSFRRSGFDWELIERCLSMPEFYTASGKPNYYAELTLWALQMAVMEGKGLPEGYDICAHQTEQEWTIFGHYCGGGYWGTLLHSHAIPVVARQLGLEKS